MLLRCLRPTVAGPPASRRGGSAQWRPEQGTARQLRQTQPRPVRAGATHPFALALVALGPNGQLLERYGVSKRDGHGAPQRRTHLCDAHDKHVRHAAVRLAGEAKAAQLLACRRPGVRRKSQLSCPNPEARGKAESRAAPAAPATRFVVARRGAARLQVTAHARLLQAFARRSFGCSFVRLPPALRSAARRMSVRAAALRQRGAACGRVWRAGWPAGGCLLRRQGTGWHSQSVTRPARLGEDEALAAAARHHQHLDLARRPVANRDAPALRGQPRPETP